MEYNILSKENARRTFENITGISYNTSNLWDSRDYIRCGIIFLWFVCRNSNACLLLSALYIYYEGNEYDNDFEKVMSYLMKAYWRAVYEKENIVLLNNDAIISTNDILEINSFDRWWINMYVINRGVKDMR